MKIKINDKHILHQSFAEIVPATPQFDSIRFEVKFGTHHGTHFKGRTFVFSPPYTTIRGSTAFLRPKEISFFSKDIDETFILKRHLYIFFYFTTVTTHLLKKWQQSPPPSSPLRSVQLANAFL